MPVAGMAVTVAVAGVVVSGCQSMRPSLRLDELESQEEVTVRESVGRAGVKPVERLPVVVPLVWRDACSAACCARVDASSSSVSRDRWYARSTSSSVAVPLAMLYARRRSR